MEFENVIVSVVFSAYKNKIYAQNYKLRIEVEM